MRTVILNTSKLEEQQCTGKKATYHAIWSCECWMFLYINMQLKFSCILIYKTPCRRKCGFPGGASGKESVCQSRRQEMQVRSLGQEEPLEEGRATDPRILDWRIPRTEKPSRLQSMGSQRVGRDWSNGKCMHSQTSSPFVLPRSHWIFKPQAPLLHTKHVAHCNTLPEALHTARASGLPTA